MALEVRKFAVTVPAGTARAAAIVFSCAIPPRVVDEIEILIPPGPRGEVGFQIAMSGRQVFPTESGAFFVTDDEIIRWPIEDANTGGDWQIIAYNTGAFNHTLELRLLARLTTTAETPGLLNPLPSSALSG